MLNKDKLIAMLTLQDTCNSVINLNWKVDKPPYLRAVIIEGAEAMEHHGWKWWKKQTKDVGQLQIELVDIWHFYLSDAILRANGSFEEAADYILGAFTADYGRTSVYLGTDWQFRKMDFLTKMELMIALAALRRSSFPLFEAMMNDVGLDWDSLYKQYIGKNVLNIFRQKNGYKEGTYIKIWKGQEDNVWLEQIMATESDPQAILTELARRYAQVKAAQEESTQ